jgi:putative phosphoribosyl transferase
MAFRDRTDAGAALAAQVAALSGLDATADAVVLGLPRGGVPVAAPVAAALDTRLDVLVVRKLGVPRQPELAMGAIAGIAGDVVVVENDWVLRRGRIAAAQFEEVRARETAELRRREKAYRGERPAPEVRGRTVVLVDDGLATGSTMRAALAALRRSRPGRVVVAVPVGAPQTCAEIAALVDELVCPLRPDPFGAVAQGYRDFSATTDEEVRRLLEEHPGDV